MINSRSFEIWGECSNAKRQQKNNKTPVRMYSLRYVEVCVCYWNVCTLVRLRRYERFLLGYLTMIFQLHYWTCHPKRS